MIRVLDIVISSVGLLLLWPVFLLISLGCVLETGSPLYRQQRAGKDKKPFILYKFRTMRLGTESVATHLVDSKAITRFGLLLRKYKLDELPQLWNVLKGDMSLVGPRPCLFNQCELIRERDKRTVFSVRPGVTGLGQIKKIDMSTPELLATVDSEMIETLTVKSYFEYIFQTLFGKGSGDRTC